MAAALLKLFGELGSQDEKVVDDAYYLIKEFLSKPGNAQLLISNEIAPYLLAGLQHSDSRVVSLTVQQLAACIGTVPNAIQFLNSNNFLVLIAGLFGSELSVAAEAEKFFIKLAKEKEGAPLIFENNVVSAFQNLLKDETKGLRVFSLFAEISTISPDLLKDPFLRPIVQSFTSSSDILIKLNFVELIEKISSTWWGLQYINSLGALQTFYEILKSAAENKTEVSRTDIFLPNKIITFVGHSAQDGKSVELLLQYPFLDIISYHLENHFKREPNYFPETTEASATAVAEIALHVEGLDKITSHPKVLPNFIQLLQSEYSPVLICAFHSFGAIFSSPHLREDHSAKLEQIYNRLPSKFIVQVMKHAQKPFEDERYSVYHFIRGLVYHQWGIVVLFSHPGFFEWLMNRSADITKEGKEWKFSIVQTILQQQDFVLHKYGTEKVVELQVFVKRGVFFTNPEVALEVATKGV